MSPIEQHYPECRFGGYSNVDGTIAFYTRVHSLVTASSVVLDVGCGRGASAADPVAFRRDLRNLKGKCRKVVGIDVDAQASANPFLDDFRLITDEAWPIEDDSIDVCLCDFVLEHLAQPSKFFAEMSRVVRPGGYFCARTPNKWGYVAMASRIIPNKHHAALLCRAQRERKKEDVFPTYYRCNSQRHLRQLLQHNGFTVHVYAHESEPRYCDFSSFAFRLGVLWQRLMPRALGSALLAFAQKCRSS